MIEITCREGGDRKHIACCFGVRCKFLQFFSALAGPITPAPICPSPPFSCDVLVLGSIPKNLKCNKKLISQKKKLIFKKKIVFHYCS